MNGLINFLSCKDNKNYRRIREMNLQRRIDHTSGHMMLNHIIRN